METNEKEQALQNEQVQSETVQPENIQDKKLKKYKTAVILLAVFCAVLLAGGAVGAYAFCSMYQELTEQSRQSAVQAAKFEERLGDAQKTIEDLEAQNAQLEEEAAVMKLEDIDGKLYEIEKIPFEVDLEDWKYLLVNEVNPLEEDFEVETARFSSGQYVDKRIRDSLKQMFSDAKKEGLSLMVCSSYRDIKKQDQLMDSAIKRYMRRGMTYTEAFYEAKEQIALTGTSEHHTGLAVDIVGTDHQSLDAAQANTAEAIWLEEHAAEYGFILRFPADKEEITGISFESWHFRYVGEEAALYMKKKKLCLEEFIAIAQLQQGVGAEERININMRKDAE